MHRLIIIFSLFFFSEISFSQTAVDTLNLQLETSDDSSKIDIYNSIAEKYIQSDSAIVFINAKKALELAISMKSERGKGRANYIIGEAFYYADSYIEAINYYNRARQNYEQVGDSVKLIEIANSIGLAYFYQQIFAQSIQSYFEGLRLSEKIGDQVQTAHLYSNISMVYTKMADYKLALENYRKALEINRVLNREESVGVNLNGIGVTFFRMEKPDSAKIYYLQALDVFRKTNNRIRIAILLNNIANIYVNQVDSAGKALRYYEEAEKVFLELNYDQNVVHVIEGIGTVYREMKQYEKAILTYNRGIELAKKADPDYQLLQLYYSDLASTFEILGKYKLALENTKVAHLYADSLLNSERISQITRLEKQFESEKKESEIERLKAAQEISKLRRNKDNYLKLFGLITALFLLVALFYMTYRYSEKKKHNKLLAEKNELIKESEENLRVLNAAKNKFFSIISHDLKNPFHLVIGYSQLLSKDYNSYSDEERKMFAHNIHKSANTIFRLLSNLLDWSRSQTNRISFSPVEIEFSLIYDNVLSLLKSTAEQKGIKLYADFQEKQTVFADPVMLETIVRNLVNNAIKFTEDGGDVIISVRQPEGNIRICVEDTGIGIKSENLEKLFQIDSKVTRKGTDNEDGTGIGLILCKELVDKHQGRIWAESTPDIGSRFFVELPIFIV